MAIQRKHQNSFSRGEIDETVIGRTDLDAFEQALKKARNVFTLNQGPVERRQGTLFRYDLGESTRIEPFIFNEDQEYIIAFQNTKLLVLSTNVNFIFLGNNISLSFFTIEACFMSI